jgi:glycosyltransferase involved in cell wall biosynthesis
LGKETYLTMNILLLCRYPRLGASSRLRSFQYLPALAEHGIQVTVSPLFSENYLELFYRSGRKRPRDLISAYGGRLKQLFKARHYDLLWVEKELFPWLPATVEVLLGRFGIPFIVDYDDAIFHRYDHSSSLWIRKLLGKKIDRVMLSAAMVTVGNDYLGDRAKAAGARSVMHLPTVVDTQRYKLKVTTQSQPFTIGWIGSPTTARYLALIREPLKSLAKKRAIRLLVVGAEVEEIPGVSVESLAWSEAREAELIQMFDVGVMPLADEFWERGKCGYKLIQYMASGLPVVASPIGVNKEIVEHGVNGYLAEGIEDWKGYLQTLIDDPQLRAEMGSKGRGKVEQNYSLKVTIPRLISGIEQLVGRDFE